MLHLWTQWRGEGGREGGRDMGGVREEAKGMRMNKKKRAKKIWGG